MTATRLALAVAAAAAALGLGACTLIEELFFKNAAWNEAYGDPSRNFIAARGFGTRDLAEDRGLETGAWVWTWRSPGSDAAFDYMSFEPAGTVASIGGALPDGLPADTPVFKLSINDLVSGGDFENFPQGPLPVTPAPDAPWYRSDLGPNSSAFVVSENGGKALSLTLVGINEYVAYGLSAFKDNGHIARSHIYRVLVEGDYAGILRYSLSGVATGDGNVRRSIELPALSRFETRALRFEAATNALLDSVRATRVDIEHALRLRLRRDETSPPLISGLYSFRVWARAMPATLPPGDAGSKSPYRAATLYLEQRQTPGGDDNAIIIPSRTAIGDTWTRCEAAGVNLDFTETRTDAVLELLVSATPDPNEPEPGSLYVAFPSLNYYKDSSSFANR